MNLLGLAYKLNKLANDLPDIANEICKEYVAELAVNLIYETPVDTSAALSNWQVGIGQPVVDFIDPHIPGLYGDTRIASGRIAYQLAKAAASTGIPGQSYWLSNNTPYIIDLNNGTSRQAPAMFIQSTIAYSIKLIQPIAKRVFNDYRKR